MSTSSAIRSELVEARKLDLVGADNHHAFGNELLPALRIKNLLRRLHLRMRRIGQHDFIDDVHLGQLLARGRDFIAAFLDPG